MGVQAQRVVGDLETLGLGHRLLAGLDFGVVKLFHPAAVQTDHVVVVLALVELVHRLAAFKVVAVQQPGLFELREHPVDGRQTDVGTLLQQVAEHVFGRHVALHATLENLEDFQAGAGGFEAGALEVVDLHGGESKVGGQAAGWPLQCPDDIGLPPSMTASSTLRLFLLALTLLAGLSGCSVTRSVNRDTFKPYVPDVVQGNFVSREQRQFLRPGMSRAQVRDVLGTPLVTSLFHADRWDYAFSIRRQGVPPQQFRLTLYFNQNDVLERIEGDELPSEAEFAQRLSGSNAGGKAPVLEATEEQLRKYPGRTNPQPTAPTQVPLPPTYPPLESAPR